MQRAGTRQRRENSNASLTSSGSHATRWSSRRQSREQTGRRSIGNLFPLTGAGTAKHMMHLATQISNKVNQLYTSRADRERAEQEEHDRKMQEETDGEGSATGDMAAYIEAVEEAEEKESSDEESGSSRDEEEEGPVEYDSELEDYDHEAAGERIASMLEGLKCQERTEIMDSLSTFYQSKMEGITDNQEELDQLEKEYFTREEETKDSWSSMIKAFEAKGMTEVQVLVKCSATLQAGANGTLRQRQRQKFSKAAKKKAREERMERASSQNEVVEEGEKGDVNSRESTPKPKRKLKPLFEDEVKPEEEPEEEEEVPVSTTYSAEDLKDQDLWDLNRARELWNKMNEKAGKVAGGRGPAIEILQAMVVVQEGNAELLRRAELAKKATATLSDTIDFLAKNVQAGIVIDFDRPPQEDEALVLSAQQLKDRLLQEVDLDELEEGLDPEELEEECQDLERILQEQERDIEALYQKREEKAQAQEEQNNNKLERALGEDVDPGESPKGGSKAKKTVFLDGRLEGIKIQGEESESGGTSMREKMKQMAKTAAALSSLKKTAPNVAPKMHSPEDFKDDPKVKMLREHIATKDAQLDQGQKLLKRMRFERKLLRYCQRKAKAGFDDIIKEFNPPSFDTFADGEGSDDSPEEAEVAPPEPTQPEQPEPEDAASSASGSETAEVAAPAAPAAPPPSSEKKAASPKAKAEASKQGALPGVAKKIMEKNAESGEGKQAELELKKEVDRLQEELTKQADDLKEEKSKQKNLRKEIKDLRKEFHTLADRSAPKTVEGIQEQISKEEEKHSEIQKEIQALKVKLGYSEEVPEIDETNLFVVEEPVYPDSDWQQTMLEDELPLELPVGARRSGASPQPENSPRGSGIGSLPMELPTLTHQGSATSPRHSSSPIAASPRTSPKDSRSPSPRPVEGTSFSLSRPSSAEGSPIAGLQDVPRVPIEELEDMPEDGVQAGTVTLPETTVASSERDPVPPLPLTPDLSDVEGDEDRDTVPALATATVATGRMTVTAETVQLNAGEEATASITELMKTQGKTEEMRNEIHEIDVKLKKLKALMKGKGGDTDSVVAQVREILGIQDEEEVKAPSAYYQMKKELREQQEQVRVLRKKWWDDHRDFDGLVEKVRNQMGGLHQLFTGPEGKLFQDSGHGGGAGAQGSFESPEASDQVRSSGRGPRGRARGSVAAQGGKGSNKGQRRLSGLIGFGAGVKAMVDGPVQGTQSAGPRHRFSMIKTATESSALGEESDALRERRTLSSLFG